MTLLLQQIAHRQMKNKIIFAIGIFAGMFLSFGSLSQQAFAYGTASGVCTTPLAYQAAFPNADIVKFPETTYTPYYTAKEQSVCVDGGYCRPKSGAISDYSPYTTKSQCEATGDCYDEWQGIRTNEGSGVSKNFCEQTSACLDSEGYKYGKSQTSCGSYGNCTFGSYVERVAYTQAECTQDKGTYTPLQWLPLYVWEQNVFEPNVWKSDTPAGTCGDPMACNFSGTESCNLAGCEYNFTLAYTVTPAEDEYVASSKSFLALAKDAVHNLIADLIYQRDGQVINSDNTNINNILPLNVKEVTGGIALKIIFGAKPGDGAQMTVDGNVMGVPLFGVDTHVTGVRDGFSKLGKAFSEKWSKVFKKRAKGTIGKPVPSCSNLKK